MSYDFCSLTDYPLFLSKSNAQSSVKLVRKSRDDKNPNALKETEKKNQDQVETPCPPSLLADMNLKQEAQRDIVSLGNMPTNVVPQTKRVSRFMQSRQMQNVALHAGSTLPPPLNNINNNNSSSHNNNGKNDFFNQPAFPEPTSSNSKYLNYRNDPENLDALDNPQVEDTETADEVYARMDAFDGHIPRNLKRPKRRIRK